jgi:GAF domain-containing protein
MDPKVAQRQAEALRMVHDINRALNTEVGKGSLLDLILDSALRLTRAERGFLILSEKNGVLNVVVARQVNREQIDQPGFKVSRGVIDEAVASAQPVILDNAKEDRAFARNQSIMMNKPISVACIPLKLKGTVIGAVYLDSRYRTGLFSADMMMILEMFADNAATAIHNAKLEAQVRALPDRPTIAS